VSTDPTPPNVYSESTFKPHASVPRVCSVYLEYTFSHLLESTHLNRDGGVRSPSREIETVRLHPASLLFESPHACGASVLYTRAPIFLHPTRPMTRRSVSESSEAGDSSNVRVARLGRIRVIT
jgi:hypothetical protein